MDEVKIQDSKNIIGKEFLNIEKIISSKNPKLYKKLPKFLINYLNRILHIKELNELLYFNRNKKNFDFVDAIIKKFGVKINVNGIENITGLTRYIVASNHPLGGLDGLALMSTIGKVNKNIVAPVNDFLMFLPNINNLMAPINKVGKNTQNVRKLIGVFNSDKSIMYFPAGLCSRKISGKIVDLEWKKTFITQARKFKRNIIPVHIDGKNSNFFYNLANLRKFFKIKFNIEMLYLANEMFKQKNKNINITIGKPIDYRYFDKRYNDYVWAQKLKYFIYKLEKDNDLIFE
ncbi:MAG: 1-acyl-sn-glycerol-3-phosphate acyltransferase [Bacteroidales bacterium]|nr:1-acyl-sn-glycerol-3-phosphate acyltransferase [Bacteroidales bacterium]